jgi:hypothetical protein
MELVKNMVQFLKKLCFVSLFLSPVAPCTVRTIVSCIDLLVLCTASCDLTNSTILTDRMILLRMNKLVPKLQLAFPFPQKNNLDLLLVLTE